METITEILEALIVPPVLIGLMLFSGWAAWRLFTIVLLGIGNL
jgi:hypothetical protein